MARPGADRPDRTVRRGRRTLTVRGDGDRAIDGATVVRAVVHARLLGLRLLTLDARVVVASADVKSTSLDLIPNAAINVEPDPSGRVVEAATLAGPALADRAPPRASADGGVRRARELLAEGTQTLARAARPA